jgi:predicted ATPase
MPIQIGRRAFEILELLVEARGELVTKDEIFRRIWHGMVVEENNLAVHISALRKALGDDRHLIRTVSGHGYRLTLDRPSTPAASPPPLAVPAAASNGLPHPPPAEPSRPEAPPTNLPAWASELIGRDTALGEVASLVAAHRIVTLTGAGGIGKTRLGLETARHLLPQIPGGVWLAELAPLADGSLVPAAVAEAVGGEGGTDASIASIAQRLGARQVLLLLDNCEHVIDAAAALAEALVRLTPNVRILATSREPLRAESEVVYRVASLDVPIEGDTEGDEATEDLLRHGAVRLFMTRVRAAEPRFSADARSAAVAAAVCRRLDGIPLAIELAAARAAGLGIEGLVSRLDDRFGLLTGGRRTALPRHQTLRATIDWSFELLPEIERIVLRRLGMFVGPFALDSATAVATGGDLGTQEAIDAIMNLVAKSLVMADVEGPMARYRLLETMRAYALEKLSEAGELPATARRHAEFYCALFADAEAEWNSFLPFDWHVKYGQRIDNVRAALDWTFSSGGDRELGLTLTARAVPLWFRGSMMDECRQLVERALARLAPDDSPDPARDMRLQATLGFTLFFSRGGVPETRAAWAEALRLAESLSDIEYRLRSLLGLWTAYLHAGRYLQALPIAQALYRLAVEAERPGDILTGDRMIGLSLHYQGDQTAAYPHLERTHLRYLANAPPSQIVRFGYDQQVTTSANLAWTLWLQGFADQASRLAQRTVAMAQASEHALSICYAMAVAACPIALWRGDLDAAERYAAILLDHAARHALAPWQIWGSCIEGAIRIRRGDFSDGLVPLEAALSRLHEIGYPMYYVGFLGLYGEALARSGDIEAGIAKVDEAIALSDEDGGHWWLPELLRARAELALMAGQPDTDAQAEHQFRRALAVAREQGALAWELRTATGLGHLLHRQGRVAEARDLLAPICDRFTDGFETADFKAARAVLETIGRVRHSQ